MNEQDIDKIARQSAKKLGLPSRRMRILKEWCDSVYWTIFVITTYWYCRIMHTIVPKKYKHRYKFTGF